MSNAVKTKNVIQIILYAILLAVSLFSLFYKPIGEEITEIFKNVAMYFTALTNAVIAICSLVGIIHCIRLLALNKRFISGPTYTFKLCVALMALVSFLLFITYLRWQEANYMAYFKDYQIKNIAFHYVTPLLCLFLFIFFDNDDKVSMVHCLWGFIPIGVYLGYVVPLATLGLDGRGETFSFFKFTLEKWYIGLAVVAGLLLAAIICSVVLWLLNRIAYLIFVGDVESAEITKEEKEEFGNKVEITKEDEKIIDEELLTLAEIIPSNEDVPSQETPVVEEIKEEEIPSEEVATNKGKKSSASKTTSKKTTKTAKKEETPVVEQPVANLKYNDGARVYHVSRHGRTNYWQVKIATGKRAIKLFDTQKEAIYFAKQLVLSRGGSIRVHAVSGRIRKH